MINRNDLLEIIQLAAVMAGALSAGVLAGIALAEFLFFITRL